MKKVFVYILPFAFFGCSAVVDPEISMKPPTYVEELAPKQSHNVESAPGSLFGKGDNPLFSDKKAMNVNDLVTVIIQESTTQSTQANKTTSRTNNANLGGGTLVGSTGAVNQVLNRVNSYSNIGFQTNSTNNYTGTGTQSRNESFNTTISTRVIKILSNGNYFIEGSRELLINGEKQIIQLSGVIRPYDIGQDNTIDSKYIADAKILYKTEGEVDRSTRKPWGSKFIEAVWPF
ncbi:flagellar basal body L-ring protein FlgH [Campylobacter upsaliensis]|uniref:flagellar basal body L-ring protein FlgH n=1 Tax=Campylobacter upsaliensis TaxID=28080 RepID=UPI00183570F5|nr:flagellar basal body L-ring protein FlgH [Campylobacter upsaliensis]MEB2792086.1 flagellar basal body L-ring protein FlgH [Campylobacter upsaliensis]MEB2803472.1 flagellar basal body L-ring protein FlgH [Campylobacter upsaliensis]MEB2811758.1 flagellar basal body L-ring protein FlgH [Campylobacter upsaliensis]MEB2817575.1 flagellar basal body L-ring protein FlgH [Campylobacter upsaliensis]MEB2822691.1 flagellar basal body L-ring protein FlgH [Campylobacter upsaliensis]